jgi:hypothetical protein
MWRAILGFLAWLSADPAAIDREVPAAAAAVAVAYAQFATAAKQAPPETPSKCCKDCAGTGFVVSGAGIRRPCGCPPDCPCKAAAVAPCPGGKCVPAASPAPARAVPQ